MEKNKKSTTKNIEKLDEIDKLMYKLAGEKEETPEHVKQVIRQTLKNLSNNK